MNRHQKKKIRCKPGDCDGPIPLSTRYTLFETALEKGRRRLD